MIAPLSAGHRRESVGMSYDAAGWAPTQVYPMLVCTGWRESISRTCPQDHTPTLTRSWDSPGSHPPSCRTQPTAMLITPDQIVWTPPHSSEKCYQGPVYSLKPVGGCWRGFGGSSHGCGWPWPHPPTTPGFGAHWGHTDGTHNNYGCPPANTQDRAHRRHDESGHRSHPQPLSHPDSGHKKSRPSWGAGPLTHEAGIFLTLVSSVLDPQPHPSSFGLAKPTPVISRSCFPHTDQRFSCTSGKEPAQGKTQLQPQKRIRWCDGRQSPSLGEIPD